MELDVRSPAMLIPDFSLTSDILSYARCGLQYRLNGLGGLPASRPVQLWYGQFLHGVLEESFRRFLDTGAVPSGSAIPDICDVVTNRLASGGVRSRNRTVESVARERAQIIVADLGPHLFPLIRHAEVRLTSTRPLTGCGTGYYQMAGIVDVISSVELGASASNPIVLALQRRLPVGITGTFEVIVDYKGNRRPSSEPASAGGADFSTIYQWQILTYAQLRARQSGAAPVVAGALLYLNELAPTWEDVAQMRDELARGVADVVPEPGSRDEVLITRGGRPSGSGPPSLSLEFRLRRAIKVVPVTPDGMSEAASKFDDYARTIVLSKEREKTTGSVMSSWTNLSTDAKTCVACDFKVACPNPAK